MRAIDDEGLISKIQIKTGCNFATASEIVDSQPTIEIPKWIPVSERLPEKDEEVWITDVEGKVERARFYKEPHPEDGEKDMFACRTYLVYAENVLAWQSVLKPEPYKEGE